jgi:hypothetical protein
MDVRTLERRSATWCAMLSVCSVALGGEQAIAANEIYCAVQDSNLDLKLIASIDPDPRGGDAVVPGSLKGTLHIYHQKVPRDRRTWALEGRTLAQYWNTGDELKLRLVLRNEDDVVDLIIETRMRPGTAGDYAGNFKLETNDPVRVTGRAECSR